MKNSLFTLRATVAACSLSICASVMAQSAYTPPAAYGSAPANVNPSAAQGASAAAAVPNAPGTRRVAGNGGDLPPGIPAAAAPMPTPLPIDHVQRALDQSAPLEPAEITRLMGELYQRQRAGRQNVTGAAPAKPVTSVETLDLSPGSAPPVVRVTLGQGAILSFSDSAGRPWPIVDNLNFNERAYSAKLIGPHLFSLTLKTNEPANITVVLEGLPRPIVITALPATDETDYLKEYTIPKFLNNAPPASIAASSREGVVSFNAPELINYLYKTPPKSARVLTTNGLPGVMAWQVPGNKMIVRTAGQVVLPAFSRRHSGTDGVTVFELPLSPIVSITEGGSVNRVSLSGYVVEDAVVAK